jgi:PEGA domain
MRTLTTLCLTLSLLTVTIFSPALAQALPVPQEKPKVSGNVLPEDTPVRLKLMQSLSSGTSKVNDKVDFEVIEAVKLGDTVVIAQGAPAIATVTRATSKKSFGRSGKLDVNIDYVRLINNEKVNLRAIKGGSGASRTGVMTGAVVATAIIFFPAAPLFFFVKGKNIEIPKGTEITAYVAADTTVNVSQPTATSTPVTEPTPTTVPAPTTTTAESATVVIKSDPVGAEITVGDKFMGTTQSTLKLAPGEHTISISKSGYKEWKRTITLNPGSEITLDASLEKLP